MAIQKYIFDSFYRYSGTNSKPRFILPNVGITAKTCYVNKVSIPHTFYNINNLNNKIYWTDAIGGLITSVISPGNYSINEVLLEIGAQMTADSTDGLTYSATRNIKTSRVTITNSGPSVFNIRFEVNQKCPACFFVLFGFYELENDQQFYGDFNRIASLSGASSYTANANYFLNIRTVYVKSNLVRQSTNYQSHAFVNNVQNLNAFFIDSGKNDIITTIPVTSTFGDFLIHESPFETERLSFQQYGITDVEFELVSDDNYENLDLNGRSWTIEVVFET